MSQTSADHDAHRTPPSEPFTAAAHSNDGKKHLLLAASGSVATIKIFNMVQALSQHSDLSIMLLLTHSATSFLAGQSAEQPHLQSLRSIRNVDGIFLDEDEWVHPWKRGAGVLHIELRRWADILVIAPVSANTMAKIAGGLSDNLLTSVVRAWDTTGEIEAVRGEDGLVIGKKKKRIVIAPSMNTAMWRHPVSKTQLRLLEGEWGIGDDDQSSEGWFEVLRPMEKELACGDVGDGAMKDWREIVQVIEKRLELSS